MNYYDKNGKLLTHLDIVKDSDGVQSLFVSVGDVIGLTADGQLNYENAKSIFTLNNFDCEYVEDGILLKQFEYDGNQTQLKYIRLKRSKEQRK